MVIIILIIILFIATVIGLKFYNQYAKDNSTESYQMPQIKWTVAFVWLILLPFFCVKFVSTGEVGVKTAFGKIVATELSEGVHLIAPWEKIEKFSIKVQKYENATPLEGTTKDLQVISGVQVAINYQVIPDRVTDLFRYVGINYGAIVLEPAIQESVKAQIAHHNAEELANARTEVSESISETLSERLAPYGIQILAVAIQNFDYSPEYNAAIEAKAVAAQEALAAKERLEKAKIEAEQKVVTAEAESKANQLLQSTLTDNVIKEKWINKWNGATPQVTGDNGFMINLSK